VPKAGAASRADYRKFKSYYIARETSPEGIHKRVERDQARRLEIQLGKLKGEHDPRTVDHKTALSKGGGNARSNLGILSAKANRRKFDH
jgi:5-methylcytosine-specific restriction endonuclease McrA